MRPAFSRIFLKKLGTRTTAPPPPPPPHSLAAAACLVPTVDPDPHRDLPLLTERLQAIETRRLHQADHVRGRVYRRQFRMMIGEGAPRFTRFRGQAARAEGDGTSHGAIPPPPDGLPVPGQTDPTPAWQSFPQ